MTEPSLFRLHVHNLYASEGKVWAVQAGGEYLTATRIEIEGVRLWTVFRGADAAQPKALLEGIGVARREGDLLTIRATPLKMVTTMSVFHEHVNKELGDLRLWPMTMFQMRAFVRFIWESAGVLPADALRSAAASMFSQLELDLSFHPDSRAAENRCEHRYHERTDALMSDRLLKNENGRLRGYGCCLRCGDTWDWKQMHDTQYDERHSAGPLCQECWTHLATAEARYPFYEALVTQWEIQGHPRNDGTRERMRAALEREAATTA